MRRREFLALASALPLAGAAPAAKLASDAERPQYHLLPAANWMNDPNGPIYWQGQYHMFYQYNPNGAFWGDMHWGHAVSADMVHWKHQPVAMAPTPGGPDKDGVFSGCIVADRGVPTAIYTGVNPEVQCIATSDDTMVTWKKYAGNPAIAAPPAGLEVAGFRDPAVWQEGDSWLMAVGSGFRGKGGAILLYESKDLRHWNYLHPLITGRMAAGASAKDPVDSGEMWECPDFFPLGGKHMLIVSTERKVKYMLGRYVERKFTAETEGLLDLGSYYAARTMNNTGERRILWGWVTETRSVEAQRAAGWSGAMSLPRELSLEGVRVVMRPAAEVEKLRGKKLEAGAAGDCVEIMAEIDAGDALQAGLKVRAGADGGEGTRIYCDRTGRKLTVESGGAAQSGPFQLGRGEPLRLRVFLDGSVMEVFANERACLTARVYGTEARRTGVGLWANSDKAKLTSLDVWEMTPISKDRLTS